MKKSQRYKKSEELLSRALKSIPLGSQTFSKSKTQLPYGVSPYFVEKANGSKIWDVDGNQYIDFVNALASVTIGYCDADVDLSVKKQLENGVTFSLPHKLETEVAEKIIELVPSAEMVRFGKNGTDATSAAIRLARAHTNKKHIFVCGYHGWQDWYIGSTTRDLGVPEEVKKLTHHFEYNNIHSLKELFLKHDKNVAAVILEPMNIAYPENNFLEDVKKITHKNDAVLIFDETITGFRFSKGGAQELFDVYPDLTTLGKGLANGYPLSAVCGSKEIMMTMEDIFFSGTFGGETLSLAAANCVLNKICDDNVIEKISSIGGGIQDGVSSLINKHQLNTVLSLNGHPSWSIFSISDTETYEGLEIKTLMMQEIFRHGIFSIGTHNVSYAHTLEDVQILLEVYDEVFELIKKSIQMQSLHNLLDAEPLKPLFKLR